MESHLGSLLRRYRAAAGLTQDGLAGRSGLSVQAISALERGVRRFPQQTTLGVLADALDLDDEQREALLAAASRVEERVPAEPPAVPRQLPYAIADFTGREDHVQRLTEALTASSGATVPIVAITGMGGVGKTALAVHVGHRVAAHYPDGQIYLDLHGYGGGEPVPVSEGLRAIMHSLGAEDVADPAMSASRLRTMLAGRRVLLLLDNVVDTDHVTDLLPGVAGSAVVVTSRRALSSLAGATYLPLDVLSEPEALAMLSSIAGTRRVWDESRAASRVAHLCGHLPLAIRVAGARLAARPTWPIEYLADRLADQRSRLDELAVADLGVRASLAVSVEQLSRSSSAIDRQAADAVAKLGLPNWRDISIAVSASLLDLPEMATTKILEHLVDANLLTATRPGFYRQHDLLRAYARDLAMETLSAADRAAALIRVLDLYVAAAWWVKLQIRPPTTMDASWGDKAWINGAPDFADSAEATAWLDVERDNILAAARQAVEDPGLDSHCAVRMAIGLHEYFVSRHDWDASRNLDEVALDVPALRSDPTADFLVRYMVGRAYSRLGLHEQAILVWRQCATAVAVESRPVAGALSIANISFALILAGKAEEAVTYADRAFGMSRELGEPYAEAYACLALGRSFGLLRMRMDQHAYLRRAHAIFARLGDEIGVALALQESGIQHAKAREESAALTALHDALEIYHRIDHPADEADVLEELGALHYSLGQFDQALDCLHEGLTISELHNEWRLEAKIRGRMGRVLAAMGRTPEAREHWQAALTILDRHGSTTGSDELRELLAGAEAN